MRLLLPIALAAGTFLVAPVGAQAPACCLEVVPAFVEPHQFLVNVTVKTPLARKNQQRLAVAVNFPADFEVDDDLQLRPFGDVKCERRTHDVAGTNFTRNSFDCSSAYSDFFFAQFRIRTAHSNEEPAAPSARLFETWCPEAKHYCPTPEQLPDESGTITIFGISVSTTTLIIVCSCIGVVLGIALFLFCRWHARRKHEKGVIEIEQARRKGEDVESQLKTRSTGVALPTQEKVLQRTRSIKSDDDILASVKVEDLEGGGAVRTEEPSGTIQRSTSKMAMARSLSQYGSNSELHKALTMVPLHKRDDYGNERRANTIGGWTTTKKVPDSTILVIKEPKPATSTAPDAPPKASADDDNAPLSEAAKPEIKVSVVPFIGAGKPLGPASAEPPATKPPLLSPPVSVPPAKPMLSQSSFSVAPLPPGPSAAPSSKPAPSSRPAALAQPVSLGRKDVPEGAPSAAEPVPVPAPASAPAAVPTETAASSPRLGLAASPAASPKLGTVHRSSTKKPRRPATANEYVLAYVPAAMVRAQSSKRPPNARPSDGSV
ncbi:hypothetical protein DFJ74DRAFT_657598 [Hyaloraphidium curvatum]|nr:hypothetical protein DFJ74DRAFT_657598 [Hyaloraphidium curvatum]